LNSLGYDYLRAGKTGEAIRIFAKNVQEYPASSNVYDSLGEAYAGGLGKKNSWPLRTTKKSVQMDPKNQHGIEEFEEIEGTKMSELTESDFGGGIERFFLGEPPLNPDRGDISWRAGRGRRSISKNRDCGGGGVSRDQSSSVVEKDSRAR